MENLVLYLQWGLQGGERAEEHIPTLSNLSETKEQM